MAVVVARVVLFSLAKAGIGKNVEKWSAKCAEYGIDCSDLYHTEDQVRAGHLVSSPTPVLSKKLFPPLLSPLTRRGPHRPSTYHAARRRVVPDR